ncbi:hypothetical protein BASA81_000212 [Batrachochytrium salamandrivorans]|nr:hypothetical protein BASA81_000212 [Batrachochytrium salamandrivorans]
MGQLELILVLACLALLQATAAQESRGAFSTFSEYEAALDQAATAGEAVPTQSVLASLEPNTGSADLSAALAKLTATATSSPTTKWPEYNPPGPYFFDTLCFGRFTNTCLKSSPNCQWYTTQDPSCYDKRFMSVTAPNRVSVPYHVRFFQFNFGVHLVEGTFFKRFYSITVDECAKLCIQAAGGFSTFPQQKRRCLSFDFYPFETLDEPSALLRVPRSWHLALNSDTKNTARMRNEDQGFTDADTTTIRIAQGDHLTLREGTTRYATQEHADSTAGLCRSDQSWDWRLLGVASVQHDVELGHVQRSSVRGGFTPISNDQHCPGLMTKTEARELCVERGGTLCANQTDLDAISGRKLGCAFDQAGDGKIWQLWWFVVGGDVRDGDRMWARCGLDAAPLQTVTSCVYSHTPDDPASANPTSWKLGSGRGLDQIRSLCLARSLAIPGAVRVGLWDLPHRGEQHTHCVWDAGAQYLPRDDQLRADYQVPRLGALHGQLHVCERHGYGVEGPICQCGGPVAPKKATKAPTTKPTKKPTTAPTKKPTKAPTQKPTKKVTEAPTKKTSTSTPTKKVTGALFFARFQC